MIDYALPDFSDAGPARLGFAPFRMEDHPVRFVQVGAGSGDATIELPATALRSAALRLIGSGMGSVSRRPLVESISSVFQAVQPAGLKIAT